MKKIWESFSFIVLASLISLISSCQNEILKNSPHEVNRSLNHFKKDVFGYNNAEVQSVLQQLRKRNASTERIALSINSNLIKQNSSSNSAVSAIFEGKSFALQSNLEQDATWQKNYTILDSNFEFVEVLKEINPNRRYRLYLKVLTPNEVQIQLQINQIVLYEGKIASDQSLEKMGLIFRPNTQLKIKGAGQPDSKFAIYLVEESDAGKIFGRTDLPEKPVLPSDHLFNPLDLDSLGGLKPHDGEHQMANQGFVTGVQVNGYERVDYQSGVLILEPGLETTVNNFLQMYNAEILEQHGQRYLIKVDLSKIALERLPDLLRTYNQIAGEAISNASFASLEGMQTFAIWIDAIVGHPELGLKGLELNGVGKSQQTVVNLDDWAINDVNLGFSWWLVDTQVRPNGGNFLSDGAWNYSIGTGIKVAVIDQSFRVNHPEVARRIKLGQVDGVDYKNLERIYGMGSQSKDHGHLTLSTLGAEKHNAVAGAGVAPNVTMIPYHSETCWEFEVTIEKIRSLNIDVISISSNIPDQRWMHIFPGIVPFFIVGPWVSEVIAHLFGVGYMEQVTAAAAQGIPVVTSAGNSSQHYTGYLPSKHPDIIAAGNAGPDPSERKSNLITGTGWIKPGNEKLYVADSSNFGDELIWAPGSFLALTDRDNYAVTTFYSGTSAASPFLSGLIALMKSRNPSLQPYQIREILRNSATNHGVVVEPPKNNGYYPAGKKVRLVNALEAVKSAGATRALEHYSGLVINDGSSKKIRLWRAALKNTPVNSQEKVLVQSVSNEVWNQILGIGNTVFVSGWSNVQAGNNYIGTGSLEVYEAVRFDNLTPILSPIVASMISPSGASSLSDFELEISGNFLYPDPINSRPTKFKLEFIEASGFKKVLNYSTRPTSLIEGILNVEHFLDISKLGDTVKVRIPAGFLPSGTYQIVFESPLMGRSLPFPASGASFTVSNQILPPAGLRISSLSPEQNYLPSERFEYNRIENRWIIEGHQIQVNANQFAGIYFNQSIRDLEVKIGPIFVPIIDILKDLAVIGIPEDLPIGIHDVIIKSNGESLTLEGAVNKISQQVLPTPEPSAPPSSDPGDYQTVRIFNIEGNDEGRIYLNDQLVLTAHAGQDVTTSIHRYGEHPLRKDKRNEIRFELTNQDGGFTYGFELNSNSGHIYRDVKGTAGIKNIVKDDGSEDKTNGIVYSERIIVNSKPTPVGSGPFWFKIYNLNDDESITIHASNETDDLAWKPNSSFKIRGSGNTESRQIPIIPLETQGYLSHCGSVDPRYECWKMNYINFSLENLTGPYSFGIEVYKGINLIYRNIEGQRNYWDAVDNSDFHNEPAFQQYAGHQYRHFPNGN